MKQIPLTQGKFALVDDEDFDRLVSMGKWYALRHRDNFYAVKWDRQVKKKCILMHRVVLRVDNQNQVDHRNMNGLDNQKHNLRNCDRFENQRNRGANKNNSSGFKGVSWSKQNKKWRADLMENKNRRYLGQFNCPVVAAKAYNDAALKYHGEFARLNEIPA